MNENRLKALITHVRHELADANVKLDILHEKEQNSGELDEFARGYHNGRVAALSSVLECLRNAEDNS